MKGKTKQVGVYELLDYHTEDSFPNMIDALGHFRDGMENYRGGSWVNARTHFEKVLALHPGDKCSEVYCGRCDYLIEHVNVDDWDGVWVLESK